MSIDENRGILKITEAREGAGAAAQNPKPLSDGGYMRGENRKRSHGAAGRDRGEPGRQVGVGLRVRSLAAEGAQNCIAMLDAAINILATNVTRMDL